MLEGHGFEHCVYGWEAEPYHPSFSHLSYPCAVIHQRLAPSLFRSTLFVFARRIK
jgi:hypothetical protein